MPFPAPLSSFKETPQAEAPIGIFDSGVGGLSVLQAIHHLLPHESLLYCADSRYTPYGDHTTAFVTDRSLAIAQWLVDQGAKAIVVACNTATTQAITTLRERLTVPVIGVEPGVKPAAHQSRSRVAGILATAGTLKSEKFQTLMQAHAVDCKLICVAGVGLVEAIEGGDIDSPALSALLERYLKPILDAGADTLALGCTHYPFLIPLIKQLAGSRLQIVDNSPPVARQLERTLALHGQLRRAPADVTPARSDLSGLGHGHTKTDGGAGHSKAAQTVLLTFCTTGTTAQLSRLAEIGLGLKIQVSQVTIASPLTCQA